MRWLKRDTWKVGIALAGLLLLLVFMVLIPVSAAYAHKLAMQVTVQATPTVDLTVTALAKEQLTLQVKQLQNQNDWLASNSTALIGAVATVVIALFGILQWATTVRQAQDKESRDRRESAQKEIAARERELKDQQAARDKELNAQAEERFKTAITALGNEKESVQVGGAILLRSFLNKDDEEIYGRYYAQIFDLAVAYLRPPNTSLISENRDISPPSSEDSHTPLQLTPFRQAMIVIFRETFSLARRKALPLMNAAGIQLDHAYLANANLRQIHMPYSFLRKADFSFTNLEEAYLRGSQLQGASFVAAQLRRVNITVAQLEGANFNNAYLDEAYLRGSQLERAHFREATLKKARLEGANLKGTNLSEANLSEADLSETDLTNANLQGANLSEANLEKARSLKNTDLRSVKGLTKEQLDACKAKGAIIDENATASSLQAVSSPPTPSPTSEPPASAQQSS